MAESLRLPRADGTCRLYTLHGEPVAPTPMDPPKSRVAYAAAHVVCDPRADVDPSSATVLDWEATLAYRRYLWSLGFGVAEAMDTAQRGMGLGWERCQELIRRSVAEARAMGGLIACGAGTDHLVPSRSTTIADVITAYEEQCSVVEATGSRIILMASRALAACAAGADEYLRVYDRILAQVAQPVILHWLGDMFDPALAGYWGSADRDCAMDACLQVISEHRTKVDGIKISLLDRDREVAMRQRLPAGVRMYTGDDFNYPELIAGNKQGHSDALLGIFDAIAPVAAAALGALDCGDTERYQQLLAPTVPLSRHIFQAPTRFYKTGIVFMAYLNGYQSHFRMVGGQESARSIVHLSELFVLADAAGLLLDSARAAERFRPVLCVAGIDQ
ncbi:MAG: dihydrodipicolinate synthase family protein [Chloroflexota bacterium]